MPRSLTPDQLRAEIVAVFPRDCGELFFELYNDVAHLHLNWQDYRSLYGTSAARIELLKWAAGSFFHLLDGVMRHDVLLRIARLTDPPSTGRRENASLSQFVRRTGAHVAPASAQRLRNLLDDLQDYCAPIRSLRNRLLAHDDLATTLHFHADPLPGVSRAYIEGALQRIRDLLNEVERTFRGSSTYYQGVTSGHNAESLIVVLEQAREHEKQN